MVPKGSQSFKGPKGPPLPLSDPTENLPTHLASKHPSLERSVQAAVQPTLKSLIRPAENQCSRVAFKADCDHPLKTPWEGLWRQR